MFEAKVAEVQRELKQMQLEQRMAPSGTIGAVVAGAHKDRTEYPNASAESNACYLAPETVSSCTDSTDFVLSETETLRESSVCSTIAAEALLPEDDLPDGTLEDVSKVSKFRQKLDRGAGGLPAVVRVSSVKAVLLYQKIQTFLLISLKPLLRPMKKHSRKRMLSLLKLKKLRHGLISHNSYTELASPNGNPGFPQQ